MCEGWSCGVYDKGGRVGGVIRVVMWGCEGWSCGHVGVCDKGGRVGVCDKV